MKVLVIGGTGHVGSFLCPILKERGHDVVICSRGKTAVPEGYKSVVCNSNDVEALNQLKSENFDTIVEFPGSVAKVYEALGDSVNHIIGCGSLWMLGEPNVVPTPEETQNECVVASGYRERYEEIKFMLSDDKCKFTVILAPNISGPGKIPIDLLGGRDINLHKAHKRGEKVYLPEGPKCLIEPCDAYDIAMLFALCVENPEASANQMFNVGTGLAMTATELVNAYSRIYRTQIPIEYVSWEKYKNEISPTIYHWWHFYADMCPDISKAKNLLGFEPKYTSEQSLERAVKWMEDNDML